MNKKKYVYVALLILIIINNIFLIRKNNNLNKEYICKSNYELEKQEDFENSIPNYVNIEDLLFADSKILDNLCTINGNSSSLKFTFKINNIDQAQALETLVKKSSKLNYDKTEITSFEKNYIMNITYSGR